MCELEWTEIKRNGGICFKMIVVKREKDKIKNQGQRRMFMNWLRCVSQKQNSSQDSFWNINPSITSESKTEFPQI